MNDVAYTYYERQKEMKNLARNARRRVTNKRPGKIMMPADYLTAKEKRKLSGEMQTYEMNKPHRLKELMTWPLSNQKEYIYGIIEKYNPKTKQLAHELLHTSNETFDAYMKSLGVSFTRARKNRTKEQIQGWDEFLGKKMPEPEQLELEPAEEKKTPEKKEEPRLILHTPEKFTVETEGRPYAVFQTIATLYCDPDADYEFQVVARKTYKPDMAKAEEIFRDE